MTFQAQNGEPNSTWKVSVSFKIIVTTSVTKPCFTTQHQTCKTKTKTKTDFWSQTGLVLRPTVSDHITVLFLQLPQLSRSGIVSVQSSSWFGSAPKSKRFCQSHIPPLRKISTKFVEDFSWLILLTDKPMTETGLRYSFAVRTVSDWNQLPAVVVEQENPAAFKVQLARCAPVRVPWPTTMHH